MTPRQSTAIVMGQKALLIEGRSGTGKSTLALGLIDRGAKLIGDDGILLHVREGKLFARPHPNIRGLLEVRNLGLVTMPICEEAPIALVIRLDPDAPRYIETAEHTEIDGVRIPEIALWPDSPALPIKAEMALEKFGLSFPF